MSQSRFSIVLVGVSALLRRPLVSRLRPVDGERSPWVVFAARGCRFDSGFRSAIGLRAHCFRFSARTALELPSAGWFFLLPLRSGLGGLVLPLGGLVFGLTASAFRHAPLRRLPLGGLAFGLTASAFRHAPLRRLPSASSFFRLPLRRLPSAGWPSGSLLPLFGLRRFGDCPRRAASSAFRFGDCRWAGWPSGSQLPLFGMHRFGNCPRRVGSSAGRVGLRAHCFRFSACAASEWPLGEFVLPLDGLAFGLTASAFRHAPLRSCRGASSFFRWAGWPSGSLLPLFGAHRFGDCPRRIGLRVSASEWPSAGWASGSLLPLFGMHRSAPPRRRSEDRRSTTTRHLFHFKTLIPTC